MSTHSRLHHAILLISIAIFPFVAHITRAEANEAHRAGLLGILILFTLPLIPQVINHVPSSRRILLYAIAFWCVVLVLSSVSSIHPLRSIIGDGQRRIGLLTHLTFVAGAFLMWRTSGKKLWYFFWIVSILGATQAILEAQTLEGVDRIYGLYGWTTFTGGWLALSSLWAILGFLIHGYHESSRLQRAIVIGSWGIIGVAFILLGTRAASLALFIGLFTAGIIWASLCNKRWILFSIVGVTLLSSSGFYFLSQVDWGETSLSQASLFQRLNFQVFDPFRQEVWSDSQKIMLHNPVLLRADGQDDPMSAIRPLVGYGLEAFEPPLRMVNIGNIKTVDDSIRTDRAHNIWYDTYVMQGWLGVIALAGIYLSAFYVSLKKLKLLNIWIIVDVVGGAGIALMLTWGTQFIPMSVTFGMLGGLLLGVIQTGITTKFIGDSIPTRAWIALPLLIAHLIELQFGFITVATTWIPWLVIGLLLFDEVEDVQFKVPNWVWLAIAGAFIVRIPLDSTLFNIILLSVAVVITALWEDIEIKQWMTIGIIWLLSSLNWIVPVPQLAILWDIILLFLMLWMFYGSQEDNIEIKLNSSSILMGIIIFIAVGIWTLDILAGIYRLEALSTPLQDKKTDALNIAVRLRPYDDRLWHDAGATNLDLGLITNNGLAVGNAIIQLNQAVILHPYYGLYVNNLARLEANLAIGTKDFDKHAQLAQQYYERATIMWSQVGELWREWARFEWDVMDNRNKALILIEEALRLSPRDTEAIQLADLIRG